MVYHSAQWLNLVNVFLKLAKPFIKQFHLIIIIKILYWPSLYRLSWYTVVCILVRTQPFSRFWRNHPWWKNKCYLIWTSLVFFIKKKKKKNFDQPNNQKPKTKKLNKSHFQGFANSQYFFVKILWIGPWVSRIDWCEGQRCGSTYMAVRLSDLSSKTV